jgi:Tfp pilus assembly protein PilF
LFTIHPLVTQSVAWIPGRNEPLLAIFIFSSFICLISFFTKKTFTSYILHVAFFMLALLTKETAVVFPAVCCCYMYLLARKDITSRAMMMIAAAWVAALVFWFLLRHAAIIQTEHSESILSVGSFWANLPVLSELAGKALFPFNLSAYATFSTVSMLIGILVLASSVWMLFRHDAIERRLILFSLLWFVFFLLPSLLVKATLHLQRYDYLEHRAYLSLAGMMILAALLVRVENLRLTKKTAALIALGVAYASLTFIHEQHFRDPLSLWTHATRTSPRAAHAFFHLGLLYDDGDLDLHEAERHYATAVELDPNNGEYHNNLGSIYAREGKQPEAGKEFQTALQFDPHNQFACYNLGSVCYLNNNFFEAESLWMRTIGIDPGFSNAYTNLLRLYMNRHQYDDAVAINQLAIRHGITLDENILRTLRAAHQ